MGVDRVALGSIAASLDELISRLQSEAARAGESDDIAVALEQVERQLQSCARRLHTALRLHR